MVWGRLGAGFALIGAFAVAIALIVVGDASAVTDATAPALTLPAAATVNATSSSGATVSFIAVATDDIQPTSISCTPASGSQFPVGTTNVTCSAADAAGHTTTASFSVSVVGAPEQLAQLRSAVLAAGLPRGMQTALLAHLDAAQRAIADGKQKQACQQLAQFSNAPADLARLANELQAALDCRASDARPALLGPRANVSAATAPGAATATIRFTGPSSSVSCTPTSPAAIGVGTSNVTCTATNLAGSVTASFLVTVVDHEAPSLTVPADIVVTAPPGSSSAVVTYVVSAADNVGIRSTVCVPPSGSAFPGGMTTVNCTATDTSGNTATGTFKVTVNFAISGRITDGDTHAPIAGVLVVVQDATTHNDVAVATSGTDGAYSVVVAPGRYIVLFNHDQGVAYVEVYWNEKFISSPPDVVVVAGSVGGIDAPLVAGYYVHGQVTDAVTGLPIARAFAAAQDADIGFRVVGGSSTDTNGNYRFVAARGSHIKVQFTARSYMPRWWNDKRTRDEADLITVTGELFNINARLTPGIQLSGRVTDEQTGNGIGSVAVVITDSTTRCCPFGDITLGVTNAAGEYSFPVPRNTPMKINFVPFGSADPRYIGEWFDNQADWDHAAVRSFNADTAGIDAALTKGVFIRGHVTRLDNGAPIERINVNANDGLAPCCSFMFGTQTDSTGNYALLVRPGTYKVLFYSDPANLPTDGHAYLEQWWQAAPFFDAATPILVTTDTPGINAALTQGVFVRGRVTDATGVVPVVGLQVSAQDANLPCCRFVGGGQTDSLGNYATLVPQGAHVKIEFGVFSGPPPGTHYLGEWWNDKASFDTADVIAADIDRNGVDARLAFGFLISGHVSELGSGPLPGVQVQVIDPAVPCCPFRDVAHTQTGPTGDYAVVVPAGSYKVQFFEYPLPAHPHMQQWWQGKPFDQGADVLVVTTDRPNIDAVLTPAVFIRGRVTDATGTAGIGGVNVSSPDATLPCCRFISGSQTDASGNYLYIVPLGSLVKVQFEPPSGSRYTGEWWNDKPAFDSADPIRADADKIGIDARLASGFVVSGRVTDSLGRPLAGFGANANDATLPCCQSMANAQTDAFGNYQLVVPAGSHVRVFFGTPTGARYMPEWWNDKPFFDQADVIDVTSDRGGIDAQLASGVLFRGRVTDSTGTIPVSGLQLTARDANLPGSQFVAGAQTDGLGNYTMPVPQGAAVKIEFGFFGGMPPGTRYIGEWWNDKATFETADVVIASVDQNGIDARLASGFVISGIVRGPSGPLANVWVAASLGGPAPCCTGVGGTVTDAFGHYQLTLPAGAYRLSISNPPSRHLVMQWWNGVPGGTAYFQRASDIILGPSDAPGRDFDAVFGTIIEGRVTDSAGAALGNVGVTANDAAIACCEGLAFAGTDGAGNYTLVVPLGRQVRVFFGPGPGSPYQQQWWNNKPDFGVADIINASIDRSGIDAHLATGFSISGHVADRATGLPIANIDVQAFDALVPCCARFGGTRTDANGNYTLTLASGATVKLVFQSPDPGPSYVQRWWHDQPDFGPAGQIAVNGSVTNIDQALDAGYRISGRVTDAANPALGVPNAGVMAQPNFSCCFYGTRTGADGRYSIVVSAATYRISFFSPLGSDFLEQWWNAKPGFSAADLLTIPSSSVDLGSINAALVHGFPVRGRVTAPGGIAGVDRVGVVATLDDPAVPCCVNYQAQTDSNGDYTMYVRAGRYRVNFQPPNTTDYVVEYWDDQPDFASATLLDVSAPTFNIDAVLERGFRISGRVTDANGGAALPNSAVTINPQPCCLPPMVQLTGPDGTYSAVVRSGSYKIGFNAPFGTDFVSQYWNAKPDFLSGDVLVVDSAKPNIDAALAHGVRLSGRVTEASDPSRGIAGVNVSVAMAADNLWVAGTATSADGTYSVFVAPGSYVLYFDPPFGSDFVLEYWNNKPDFARADVITVTAPMANLDAGLERAVTISGRVTDTAGTPIQGIVVNVASPALPFTFVTAQVTDAVGRYSIKVQAGSYKVFFGSSPGLPFVSEWWRDQTTFETADVIDASSSGAIADGVLTRGVVISGRVTVSGSGAVLSGASVFVYDATKPCCAFIDARGTGPDGTYSFALAAGSYWVSFFATGYAEQWWNARTSSSTADILSGTTDHLNVNAAMVSTGP